MADSNSQQDWKSIKNLSRKVMKHHLETTDHSAPYTGKEKQNEMIINVW